MIGCRLIAFGFFDFFRPDIQVYIAVFVFVGYVVCLHEAVVHLYILGGVSQYLVVECLNAAILVLVVFGCKVAFL